MREVGSSTIVAVCTYWIPFSDGAQLDCDEVLSVAMSLL